LRWGRSVKGLDAGRGFVIFIYGVEVVHEIVPLVPIYYTENWALREAHYVFAILPLAFADREWYILRINRKFINFGRVASSFAKATEDKQLVRPARQCLLIII
jgi:hypothetical protein